MTDQTIIEAALQAAEAKKLADEVKRTNALAEAKAIHDKRAEEYIERFREVLSTLSDEFFTIIESPHEWSEQWNFKTVIDEFSLILTVERSIDFQDRYSLRLSAPGVTDMNILVLFKYKKADMRSGGVADKDGWEDVLPTFPAAFGQTILLMRERIQAQHEKKERLARQQAAEAAQAAGKTESAQVVSETTIQEVAVEQPKLPKEIQGLVDDLEVLLTGLKNGTWKKLQPHYQAMVHLINAANAFADADDDVRYGG